MIEILRTGPFATVQDLGREGFISEGIGPSGAMDRLALRRGNRLTGNPDGAAAIETTAAPLELRLDRDALVAVTGAEGAVSVNGAPIPTNWAEPVRAGDALLVAPSASGMWRYVAISGGVDAPMTLGSRSTDLKNGFGGVGAGRPLRAGDRLPLGAEDEMTADWREEIRRFDGLGLSPPKDAPGEPVIRVMKAREHNRFTEASREAFWRSGWRIGGESNRQGYRLTGPQLETETPMSLLSYGLIAGTIQVPQSGQPIVQLAEANTCGGYPKLGVVIEADLGRLAQVRHGETVRFRAVTRGEAIAAMAAEEAKIAGVRAIAEAVA
ncbi:MAG: biotin-dependent carboxyltransferase family protein [Pseudomonadota bacterium]